MTYTKEQLLGSIFSWGDRDIDKYEVVHDDEDVCLKNIITNDLFKGYSVKYLNSTCLKNLDISTLNPIYINENQDFLIKLLKQLGIN